MISVQLVSVCFVHRPIDEEAVMKWTKPAFKTLELASEVTAYRHTR